MARKATIKGISKEAGIELCVEQMSAGKSRKEIVQTITNNYKLSDSTVDKWIKQARIILNKRNETIEKIRVVETDKAVIDAVKEGLKSDLELEIFLCQIALGDLKVEELIKGKTIIRDTSPFERIKAIEVIYKKRGSYSTEKVQPETSCVIYMESFGDSPPLAKNENDVDINRPNKGV